MNLNGLICNDFLLLSEEREGCVMGYLIQPQLMVCGKERRCLCCRLGILWVRVGEWSGVDHRALQCQWCQPTARALGKLQLSPRGSHLSCTLQLLPIPGLYPGKLCAVEPQSMLDRGLGHREGEAGEQGCVLFAATDSLWLQASRYLCFLCLMRFMAVKTLQNLWTHWFINNFLCLLGKL